MNMAYGRSRSGTRVIRKTNQYPFKKFNLIVAIKYNKVVGWILFKELKGGIKKEELTNFNNKYIAKKYKNHLILMDNASSHKAKIVKETIEETNDYL